MEDLNQSAAGSDVANVLSMWRNFDLDGRRLILDKQCLEMRDYKAASVNGRKRLNDITKNFRSKSKEEQLIMMTEILKAYQEEIDQLSRRSKSCESAFHGLYKAIYEAPDPVPVIENLLLQVASSSTHLLEIKRLKNELHQYDEEFQRLKNQDITIRHLEDQVEEYKEQLDEKVSEEVAARLVILEEQNEIKIQEIRDHQHAVERRLNTAVEAMRQAQIATERAQSALFDVSSQAESRIGALVSENSMLAESAERAQARIGELENELRLLSATTTMTGNANSGSSSGGLPTSARNIDEMNEDEIKTLHMVLAELRQEIRQKEDLARQDRLRLEASCRDISQQLITEKEITVSLRQELAERPTKSDLSNVRRQLSVLQRVAFNVQDDENEEMTSDPERTLGEQGQGNLEVLLASRLKALESELSEARRSIEIMRAQELKSKATIAGLQSSLESSTALISRLESDLEEGIGMNQRRGGGMKKFNNNNNSVGNANQNYGDRFDGYNRSDDMGLSELLLDDIVLTPTRPSSSLPTHSDVASTSPYSTPSDKRNNNNSSSSIIENAYTATTTTPGGGAGGASTGNGQMVAILQAQRDRYKDRVTKAESQLLLLQQELQDTIASKEQLENDNLSLYGKIRYLQSYFNQKSTTAHNHRNDAMSYNRYSTTSGGGGSSSSGYDTNKSNRYSSTAATTSNGANQRYDEEYLTGGSGGSGEATTMVDIEGKYRSLYETKMNPFVQFSQHEKQRKLQELTVADRIVLNTAVACVSSHAGRSFLLVYLICMHLLVFFTMYYAAHNHPTMKDCPHTSVLLEGGSRILFSSILGSSSSNGGK